MITRWAGLAAAGGCSLASSRVATAAFEPLHADMRAARPGSGRRKCSARFSAAIHIAGRCALDGQKDNLSEASLRRLLQAEGAKRAVAQMASADRCGSVRPCRSHM